MASVFHCPHCDLAFSGETDPQTAVDLGRLLFQQHMRLAHGGTFFCADIPPHESPQLRVRLFQCFGCFESIFILFRMVGFFTTTSWMCRHGDWLGGGPSTANICSETELSLSLTKNKKILIWFYDTFLLKINSHSLVLFLHFFKKIFSFYSFTRNWNVTSFFFKATKKAKKAKHFNKRSEINRRQQNKAKTITSEWRRNPYCFAIKKSASNF